MNQLIGPISFTVGGLLTGIVLHFTMIAPLLEQLAMCTK